MITLPYIDHKENRNINLLIVEPYPKEATVTAGDIFIPANIGDECEEGKVISVCPSSEFSPGDRVVYKKMDRDKKENYETVEMDGKTYDIIGEKEVWEVNGKPYNRIFVEPLSVIEMAEDGIVLPQSAQGITQKGIVYKAPDNFFVKKGDTVEYRKNSMRIYYTANENGVDYDILYEPDIFLVNDKVSPHKIIVKIDLAAQQIKRQTNEMGISLSPLFQRMTRMLQYGEVTEIGEEAQKIYPKLVEGDTAILHHSIEYDDYRVLKMDKGKHGTFIYEYRVINCFDVTHREIFGRISNKKLYGKIPNFKIIPFHKNIFLKWDFELLEKENLESQFIDINFSLDDCKNKEDLESTVTAKREASVRMYKSKWQGYQADLALYNPMIKQDNDKMREIGAKIDALKREAESNARYVQQDHLLRCKIAFPLTINNEVITTYKHLYPINILGKKYLIAHKDLLIANRMENTTTGWLPIADQVLVQPVEEKSDTRIFIPDSAREKPQQALVIAVGKDVDPNEIQEGDTIFHRKISGVEMNLDGTNYLMLRRNDIFASNRNIRKMEEEQMLNGAIATDGDKQ